MIALIMKIMMGSLQVRYVQPAEEEVCETKGGEEGQVMLVIMMMMRRIMMMVTRNTGDKPSCQ